MAEKGIHFKCSNFGDNLLQNILETYSYITAVSQNTCLPKEIADRITYKKKTQSSEGHAFFIDKDWMIYIVPYILVFLRIIKTVELSNALDKEYHVHRNMFQETQNALIRIFKSGDERLTNESKEVMLNKCLEAIET